jgi:hypothetical protein
VLTVIIAASTYSPNGEAFWAGYGVKEMKIRGAATSPFLTKPFLPAKIDTS